MISVERRKLITEELSFCYEPDIVRKFWAAYCNGLTLTRAPMTPREVRRRYSKGRVLEVVLRKG
jgi:hypothetical protein